MEKLIKGDIVKLNDKYHDKRDQLGVHFVVIEVGEIGGKRVIWTDPSLGGAYAADGFDLVERDA